MSGADPLVLDATVVSNFASSDSLRWLAEFESPIDVPTTVRHEIRRGIENGYDFLGSADEFFALSGVSIVETSVSSPSAGVSDIQSRLDLGESAAILRTEHVDGILATDDATARSLARDRGLPLTGSVEILISGIDDGNLTVDSADAWLDTWIETCGYHAPVNSVRDAM